MHKDWKFLHAALLVKDLDKAMKHFEALGVGPFPAFVGGPEGTPVIGKTVRGEPSDYDMDLRLADGGMGGIGFELIQPLKGESIYDEFLAEKGEGIHHLAYLVEDLDKEIAEMAERGFKVLQTGARPQGKWAYFDTDKVGGAIIELVQRF
jgi:catechol 2,3-dioxygenase-like lactoylglutathione lyase family enzyme